MKLTIVGHWGGFPKVNEASSGYIIEENGYHLLVDCGSGVLSLLQNFLSPEEIDAVILSHHHPDHMTDIGVLQHALLIGKHLGKSVSTLPIYAHSENHLFPTLTYKDLTTGMVFNPNECLQIGPFSILFLKTIHSVSCYAMRIEANGKSIVYTADSAYQDAFVSFSRNCDILLCESNFYDGMDATKAGHMTSTDAGKLASLAAVNTLILTHLPHFGDLNELKKEAEQRYSGKVLLAEKGLTIEI
ncbi:ribonuclease BN (tRNA processing enzyme) [Oikeobacillus pervagus]|uniref:Ribonuclease BN (tRNA processing enzyme) n=1 Tax=Oikeobacillus pervagus TaxID=1325931 RepID=A0AAJ1T4Q7_9BACI|nr:MBL fold metallo-hydrolase [Oikeobacillus pervagus]MDQ0214775.1 ribonuclease BN (tRNA processing enzyme) [Oikeobacillus pervagus]